MQSPKEVVRRLGQSLQRGDAEGVRQCLYGEDELEREWIAAQVAAAEQTTRLRQAAEQRFGAAAAAFVELGGGSTLSTDWLAQASEQINENMAVVHIPQNGAEATVRLVKIEAGWRIRAADMLPKGNPALVRSLVRKMRRAAELIGTGADDVAAGRFASAQEAAQAIRHRIEAGRFEDLGTGSGLGEGGAATRPTTRAGE